MTVSPTLRADGNQTGGDRPPGTDVDTADSLIVTHSLRAEGFDASEDGTGRGTPLVPVSVTHTLQTQCGFATEDGTGRGSPLVPVAFSYKDSGNDAAMDLSPTLRSLGAYDANGGGQMAVTYPINTQIALRHQALGERTGLGIGSETDPGFTLQAGHSHAVAVPLRGRDGGATAELGDEVQNCLRASQGGGDKPHVLVPTNHGDNYGQKTEANTAATLRALRDAVGEEAFAEWRSRILNSLQSPEVLRPFVHGSGVRRAAREAGCWVDDGALSRPQDLPAGALLTLWEDGPDGRSPQGRELAQQLAGQLGQALPVLPPVGTQTFAVRRLTPKEAERLQGFPDGYTMIPWKKREAADCPDGPRYKALGNSMAVPVMRWIGRRITRHLRGEI